MTESEASHGPPNDILDRSAARELTVVSAVMRMTRAALGISQTEFAEGAGLSLRTVAGIELMEGRIRPGTQDKISAYLKSRNVTVLLGRDDNLIVQVPLMQMQKPSAAPPPAEGSAEPRIGP